MKQVSSLSHVISEEGITVDLSKIRDVLSWNALLVPPIFVVSLD
jgi:hypothetical protein